MIKITWIVNSSSHETVHRNGKNLSMRESYLGCISKVLDKDEWYIHLGGELGGEPEEKQGPFYSYTRARIVLLLAAEKKVG